MKQQLLKKQTIIILLLFSIFICESLYALSIRRPGAGCRNLQYDILKAITEYNEDRAEVSGTKPELDYSQGFEAIIQILKNDGYIKGDLYFEDREKCFYHFIPIDSIKLDKNNKRNLYRYPIEDYVLSCDYHGSTSGLIKPSKAFERYKLKSSITFIIWYYTTYNPFPLFVLIVIILIVVGIFASKKKKNKKDLINYDSQ